VQDGSLVATARNVHKRANSSRSVLARPMPLRQSLTPSTSILKTEAQWACGESTIGNSFPHG
jgi:hypothetical protein